MKKWKNDNDSETIIWTEKLFYNRPLNSDGFTVCHTVSYGCLSHGLTVASSLLTVLQILRGFCQTRSFYENKHRQHIQMLLKDTFLVWLTKTKQEIAVLLLLSWALLFIILVKTHMENPFQCKQLSDSLKIAKICTTKYNRQLSSK